MKTKEQIRKLAAVCSRHCFEVADKADVDWKAFRRVSIYGKTTLTWFEKIFEEYKITDHSPLIHIKNSIILSLKYSYSYKSC